MAFDMFLKLDGIKGESLDSKHKDEIHVLAWSWGASQSGTTHVGTGSGAGKVNVQDISVTKYVDKASVPLLQHCATGKHIPKGLLVIRKAGEKPLEYLKIDIKDIIVTHVSTGGSGGEDQLTENVSLNFGEFKLTYTPQNADGSGGAASEFGYSMQKNEKV